jgi:hypothetical protein
MDGLFLYYMRISGHALHAKTAPRKPTADRIRYGYTVHD